MKGHILFLQYCLDDSKPLPASANAIDWMEMIDWAEKQAIVGVIYEGMLRAGKALGMPFDALMEWTGYAQQIEVQNKILYKRCEDLGATFIDKGIAWCLLKGQGNALLYPNPFLRTSGDIDALIFEDRKTTVASIRRQYPQVHENFIHIDYPIFDDACVEIHFWPSYSNNPILNRRIRKWFKAQGSGFVVYKELPEGKGEIPVPTFEFNVVYQLMHIMHHFFDEGIGLRQFVDYYYLLKSEDGSKKLRSQGFRAKVTEVLKWLNLYQFAGAVMYIQKEVLGLDERYLIVEPDEWRGKTLLEEILKGGNFGRSSKLDQNSTVRKYFQKIWRNMHFVRQYPAEALCEPVFRTWHFFWRIGV